MGALIEAIINFFKSLFGGGAPASAPGLPSSSSAGAGVSASSSSSSSDDDSDSDSDSDDGGGGSSDYAEEQWKELQQLIARVESGGVNLNGVDWQQPVQIWTHQFAIEEAQSQGMTADQGAQKLGYANQDHFRTVLAYVSAKWSRIGTNDDGEKDIILDDRYQNSMIEARMGQMGQMRAAAAAADPTLLEPVEGVTVEAWAGASAELAGLGQGATPQQVAQVFAKYGMDKAKYDAANAGWQAKMQGDTTAVIATKFGEAFAAAQGQAGGWSMDQKGGGGAEPVSFDKYVEIMVAQGAWAEQGMDVNAQLRNVFGIDAATYSRYASYWSPKMSTDMAMIRKYNELEAKYKAKYKGAGMDDDLSL
jgi:hypothetical protein